MTVQPEASDVGGGISLTHPKRARRRARVRRIASSGLPVVLLVAAGLAAPWLAPYPPEEIRLQDALASPGARHLLGADNQGRDLLSRLLFGARLSLGIAMLAVGAGAGLGIVLGILAGFYPRLDALIMRLMDVLLAFPGIIVALTIIAILGGQGASNLVLAIAVYQIPQFARVVRAAVLTIRQEPYIEAAVALGTTDRRLIRCHIVPNVLNPVLVNTSLLIPDAIMTAAVLSFLGLGVPPPTAEWGSMLQNSLQWFPLAPHITIGPGLALTLTVFSFNRLGDALRDTMDPRLRPL